MKNSLVIHYFVRFNFLQHLKKALPYRKQEIIINFNFPLIIPFIIQDFLYCLSTQNNFIYYFQF